MLTNNCARGSNIIKFYPHILYSARAHAHDIVFTRPSACACTYSDQPMGQRSGTIAKEDGDAKHRQQSKVHRLRRG